MSTDTPQVAESILVIDDECDIREILKAILTLGGYPATEVRDGQ